MEVLMNGSLNDPTQLWLIRCTNSDSVAKEKGVLVSKADDVPSDFYLNSYCNFYNAILQQESLRKCKVGFVPLYGRFPQH